MPIALFYVLFFLGLFILSFAINAALLRVGLRWAEAQNLTIGRIALALILVIFVQTVIGAALLAFSSTENALILIALGVAAIANSVLVPGLLIAQIFTIRFVRAFVAYLPSLIFLALLGLLSSLVIRPYVVETYAMAGSGMAPTVLGVHRQGVCQECGKPGFCTVIPGISRQPDNLPMICQAHFHVTRPNNCSDRICPPDRVIVAKFVKPKRWDVVVFHSPANPDTVYCKRLVGLPGESIEIREGSVWADGVRLVPPDYVREIQYVSEIHGFSAKVWGTSDHPALLAQDEYFVLGDFSENSEDSRFWNRGAPGHPPYAVPESYVAGVATHIIWPSNRWRTLR